MVLDQFSNEKLRFSARYPFTKTARQLLSEKPITIDYQKMQFAKKRILDSLFREDVSVLMEANEELYQKYLVSYPLARMIVSLFDSQVRNRFVNYEAKRAMANIRADNPDFINEAKRIAKELDIDYDGLYVSVETYLINVPKTDEGRLVFQNLNNGRILLDENKFMSVLNEAIRNSIESGLPIHQDSIPLDIKNDILQMGKEIEDEINKFKEVKEKNAVMFAKSSGVMAPCMAKIVERARNGENLPHFARVAVASYLLKFGKSVDEVVEVFSNTPNFDEKIARYQVEFIAKKGYSPPSCQVMESYGLRLPECGCLSKGGPKNPLHYGSKSIFKPRKRRSSNSFR